MNGSNAMKNRIFKDTNNEGSSAGGYQCLEGNDVMTAMVSDHHPVIHNGVLFWNVMMQGKMRHGRGGMSYNNGLGIIETEKQYVSRLVKVAHVIAEIVDRNPSIETIGLCEGPIEIMHTNIFLQYLRDFAWMQRFFKNNNFFKPDIENQPNWGLLMLTDNNNHVSEVKCSFIEDSGLQNKLANRFQLWRLTRDKQDRYFVLAHFPFGGDEHITEVTSLSGFANQYRGLINHLLNHYSNDDLIICADFNFNPYLINGWKDRVLDEITPNNSILITTEEKNTKPAIKSVTVDGILLSLKEKQKLYAFLKPGARVFNRLKYEYYLFKSYNDKLSNILLDSPDNRPKCYT